MVYKPGDFLGMEVEIDDDRFERIENEIFVESKGKFSLEVRGTKDTPYFEECEFCNGEGFIDSDPCFSCNGEGDRNGLFVVETESGKVSTNSNQDDDLISYTDNDIEYIIDDDDEDTLIDEEN